MVVSLVDGRKVIIPLVWFPRLASATKGQLENYELLGDGEGIHWPDIDVRSQCCRFATRKSLRIIA